MSIPRVTYDQWAALPHIATSDLQPGDLLFYNGEGHVSMYVGNEIRSLLHVSLETGGNEGSPRYGRPRRPRRRAHARASTRARLSEASTTIVTSTAGTQRTSSPFTT
jgi:hypothetical protein